uniref:Ferritin n=1 Tax=Pristhesancus plagipennis TaxID=1955184 RepID=A0A2K8JSG7_PRIPG|nr:secreted Ferritin-like protein [Pristhesancus plagipennis]
MKFLLIIGVLVVFPIVFANGRNKCKLLPATVPTEWLTMVDSCTKKMKEQINEELTAAMTYMAMGAHFSRDTVNRPGFAKMFFEAASEERQHAIKIIEYLLMRGDVFKEIQKVIDGVPAPLNTTWANGQEALNEALKLEAKVTRLIIDIIKECETPQNKKSNDYHLVDYLTGDFLTEQYQGQRDLAGKSSTLGKMIKNHGALGEFLFDKKLLKGEL